jgi:hypothetical protein
MSGDQFIEKLAGIAAEVNCVEAVHALPGGSTFAAYVQHISADYWATHDDDSGYGAWLQARWPEAQRLWAEDVATVTGAAERPAEVEDPDARAILEAAAAWERDGADLPQRHYAILTRAVLNRRGPFAQFLERQLAACRPGEDPNQRIALYRDEMRRLFHADARAVIREARDQ